MQYGQNSVFSRLDNSDYEDDNLIPEIAALSFHWVVAENLCFNLFQLLVAADQWPITGSGSELIVA